MCLDLSFLLALYILFFSFFFFKSLPVIILSLDQSSIDQSNGSSIDPSTFFFISSLFICIVFFFGSIAFLSFSLSILYTLVFLHLYLTSRRRPSLLKKIAFPCILLFDSDLFCFAFCAFFHWH